jgi:hypothetical protein
MTALHAWALATVVGGLVGWGIWSIWRDRQPLRMTGAWLDRHATGDARTGWEGPRWRLPAEQRERADRDRLVRIAESRRRIHEVRRKDGTA